ncbi:MAG: hypothetical protein LAT51_05775 [Flavobacteriaceae bacterium]|nr:hypothetical protein [Flavobacteriaceae bacterium]
MEKQQFKVIVFEAVADEIQEAIDYYNKKQRSLGLRFYKTTKNLIKSLEKDALLYQVKYQRIRCVKINKFPYLIHYELNEELRVVYVYALICSYKNPDESWVKENSRS